MVVYLRNSSAAFASAGCGGSGPASAEGRRVQPPLLIHAGDQRERPRRHQADKQFVGLAGGATFEIEVHQIEYSSRFDGSRLPSEALIFPVLLGFLFCCRKFIQQRLRVSQLLSSG